MLEQATSFYQKLGIDISKDIVAYSHHGGYVSLTPDYCIWGKPVQRAGGLPDEQWNVSDPDAWYIRFAIGEGCMQKFMALVPYHLPYIGWSRYAKGRPVQYFKYEQIIRK